LILALVLFSGCSSPEEKAQEFYENGMKLFEEGKFHKARLEFRNALQIDKKMVDAWYGLALISEKNGKWKEHFGILKSVIELDPKHIKAHLKLGRLLLVSGQLDESLETSKILMSLDSEDANVLSLHAAILLKLEDTEGAVEFAKKALDIQKNIPEALIVLATEKLNNDSIDEAIKYLDRGLESEPDNVALNLVKLQALQTLKDVQGIEKILNYLINIDPENKRFSHTLAKFYIQNNRKQEAEKIYRDLALANPDDIQSKLNVIRFVKSVNGIEAAISELKTYIEKDPGNVELQFVLAQFYQSVNQSKEAVAYLEKLAEKKDSVEVSVRAKGMLAVIAYKNREEEKVKRLINEILEVEPRNQHALLLKAADQLQQKNTDQAISNLRTILKESSGSAPALRLLAKAHEINNAPELAEDIYARAFEASKQAPDYALEYAVFLLKIGRTERAASILEDALRLKPDHWSMLTLLAELRVKMNDWLEAQKLAERIAKLEKSGQVSQQIMGAVYAGRQNYEKSLESFKEAYNASPTSSQRPMISLVRAYVRANKLNEAHDFLDSVLELNKNNNNARLLKAEIHLLQGEINLAIQVYKKAIDTDPSLILAYYNLAKVYLRLGKADDALSVLDDGIATSPENIALLMAIAGIFEGKGEYGKAIDKYEKIIRIKPDDLIAINNLASLLSEYRDDEDSLNRAFKLASSFQDAAIPQFIDTLGWIYYKQGKYQEANELILKAAEKSPKDVGILFHLGMSYESLNEADNARVQFRRILEIAGDRNFALRQKVEEALARLGVENEIKAVVNQ